MATIQSLTEQLGNVNLGANRGRRRRRRRAGVYTTGSTIPGAEGAPMVLVSSTNRGRRRRRRGTGNVPGIGNGGVISLTRCELLYSVTVPANSKGDFLANCLLAPQPSTEKTPVVMPFLFQLAQAYCRLRWDAMVIEWRPACGTTTNGIVTYGVRLMEGTSGGQIQVPKSRIAVSALYPVNDHPVWQGSSMVVNRDLLQSRRFYAIFPQGTIDAVDIAPGALEIGISSDSSTVDKFLGEFWISYKVTLDGSRLAGD